MAEPQQSDIMGALGRLPDAEREKYLSTYQEYLGKLPQSAYNSALTRLTNQYGPEFASAVAGPVIDVRKPVAVPEPQVRDITKPPTAYENPIPWLAEQPLIKPFADMAGGLMQQPILKTISEQPLVKPIVDLYGKYENSWIKPAAMGVGQVFSSDLREGLQGRSPFDVSPEERSAMWEENQQIPWIARTALEMGVDPISYVGWGIPGMAEKAALKGGQKALAAGIHALGTVPEELFTQAANLPVKMAGQALKSLPVKVPQVSLSEFGATGKFFTGKWGKPFDESARTIAGNTGTHAFDALSGLERAGAEKGKPFSQILEDLRMGIPDQELIGTIKNPLQQRALGHLQENIGKLNMDSWIKFADRHPIETQVGISTELKRLVAQQLGVAADKKATGMIGLAQRLYNWWRPMVLQTPYYVMQNLVENNVRQILDGISPIFDITDFAKLSNLAEHPIDIQRKIISLRDRWMNKMPEAGSILAKTPSSGNITDALTGHLSRGHTMPATTIASYLDDVAMVNTYFNKYNSHVKMLMEKSSPETAKALSDIQALVADLTGKVEPQLAEHLGNLAVGGTTDDFVRAMAEVQSNKTLTIARPMNDLEKGIPMAIQDKIKYDLPRLWARNDLRGITNLFEELKRTLPQRIESYQKQKMLSSMKEYRDLSKTNMPANTRTLLTKAINSFKANRIREAEQAAKSHHSLSAFQQAMFDAHVASRRELEDMAEVLMVDKALRGSITPEELTSWYNTSRAINDGAFGAGKELVDRTFQTADTIRFAKDPTKVQSAWDNYIRNIQSDFPEIAEGLKAIAPNNDDLWHAYRQVQERRWFNVGQEKLTAMGLDYNDIAKVAGADGKILTQEDFLSEQLKALKGWEDRVVDAWDNRHNVGVPSAANDLKGLQAELGALIPNNTEYKGVQINYTINKNGFEIDVIKANNQKAGAGTKVLQEINDMADKYGVPVKVHAQPLAGNLPAKPVKPVVHPAYEDATLRAKIEKLDTLQNAPIEEYDKLKDEILAELENKGAIKNEAKPIAEKIRGKDRPNSLHAQKDLDSLQGKGYDTSDAEDALSDYQGIERSDYSDAEEFSDARAEAWDEFLDKLDEIEPTDTWEEQLAKVNKDFKDYDTAELAYNKAASSGSTMTQEQLEAWYTKQGFKPVGKSTAGIATVMERPAKVGLTKNQILDDFREKVIAAKESVAIQSKTIHNQASNTALNVTYGTYGNYAQRTNLDEFMTGMGAPFWFFPSRSIPYYTTQLIKHPGLGIETLSMQKEANESANPSRLFGAINIPGTDYWYNPLQSSMWWQLTNPMSKSFNAAGAGGLEQGDNFLRNQLGVSLGPQWKIASSIVERVVANQTGQTALTAEPQAIIPQQRWLQAVAGLKLPQFGVAGQLISGAADTLNQPFDAYLRAVYGDTVAEYAKREVEKTIVDMGFNPQTASPEVIKAAWDKYYTRQLWGIPGGAVKEMNPTEQARFQAMNQKAKDMGLNKEQRTTYRDLNESPFTGLRQDQLEAVYKDIPAAKLWRYIRPSGLTTESRPIWEDYIKLKLEREKLLYGTDPNKPDKGSRLYTEQAIDRSLRTGKITPREWKALYRQNYDEYINKVDEATGIYKKAPQTDADWEAYRKMLGWDTPVRHPDDIKLDEYYKELDSSKFTDEIGSFDYNKYRDAEQKFLSTVTPEQAAYIQSRKDRYKTPLRATYSNDMVLAQPYYDIQDQVLAQYPPDIKQLIEYAQQFSPVIQKAYLARSPQALLALRKARLMRDQYRTQHPNIDRILRYWNS